MRSDILQNTVNAGYDKLSDLNSLSSEYTPLCRWGYAKADCATPRTDYKGVYWPLYCSTSTPTINHCRNPLKASYTRMTGQLWQRGARKQMSKLDYRSASRNWVVIMLPKSWKPIPEKVSCMFHLNNRKSKETLDLNWNGVKIEHDEGPKYLGVPFERTLFQAALLKHRSKNSNTQ